MSINSKYEECGNATIISDVCNPYRIPMFKHRAIVDYCIEQLAFINIKRTKDEYKIYCEQILRVMVDISNEYLSAYIIFSNQRENFNEDACFTIRKLFWDKKKDIARIKQMNGSQDKRQEVLSSWPAIKVNNVVFNYRDASFIEKLLQQTDELTKSGILLSKRRTNDKLVWENMTDVEIMRRYDWGEVRSCWGIPMENNRIERHIKTLIERLEKAFIQTYREKFYKMELDYIYPINNFNAICYREGT